jgi:hypothetical protein
MDHDLDTPEHLLAIQNSRLRDIVDGSIIPDVVRKWTFGIIRPLRLNDYAMTMQGNDVRFIVKRTVKNGCVSPLTTSP